MERRIILAAGHGGGDPGALGQGTNEAAEVIDIVNRAAQKLKADGQIEVIVVPHELNLDAQIDWVNERYSGLNQGYALEVHKNATVNATGIEGWFYRGDPASQHLVDCIVNAVCAITGLRDRGNKADDTNRHGKLAWITDTKTNAGLLESGFISDGGDPVGSEANEKYAQGIYLGTLAVWGLAPAPAPVVHIPAQVKVAYRVYSNEKQIGAYTKRENAWAKYRDAGGVRIVNADGVDVTAEFVTEFRPTEPMPSGTVEPHPEVGPQTEARLTALETAIAKIKELLAKWGINL